MDTATRAKWDRASRTFDLMSAYGPEWRWRPAKLRLFERMRPDAKILFLALGTGLDISCFPRGRDITAIDISPKMVERAQARVAAYDGNMTALVMDVHAMTFPEASFDQVFTSCTFCSVPNPVAGLIALHQVLKPGGELHMFEHTGSRWFPFNVMMKLMSPLASRFGPELDRDTVTNVRAAGFRVTEVNHVFLDTVKTIHAVK
ncbi:MAG: class I SAM-dependent methyltransferase [Chromatiales bacterium]|nr:MAG: class I SAM-dependent methyltransferase [Chromatiales bacterium]